MNPPPPGSVAVTPDRGPRTRGGRRGSRRGSSAAFTLVELLVVTAIVAVLAALLLPALARVKGVARRTECQARMRQWATALIMYKDDANDEIPREGYEPFGETHLNNWAQIRGRRHESDDIWYNALPPYLKVPPASLYADERLRFYQRATLFHCPAARFPAEARYSQYSFALFTIALNSQLIQLPHIPTIKFTRIRREAGTVLFAENRLEGEPKVCAKQPNDNLGQPATYALRFVPRHAGGGNLAFADSHVTWFRGDQVVETRGLGQGGPAQSLDEVQWDPE